MPLRSFFMCHKIIVNNQERIKNFVSNMAEIIVLSDSDESILSVDVLNSNTKKAKSKHGMECLLDNSDLDNFEFPEVNFYHIIDEEKVDGSQNKNNNISHEIQEPLNRVISSSDSPAESDVEKANVKAKEKDKNAGKKSKYQLYEKKLKRQEILKREKALKTIASKKEKNIKPGECMKFIEVVLDKAFENFPFVTDIVNTLTDANLQYSINTGFISNSITWKRCIENGYVNEANEICMQTNIQSVNQVIIVWNWDEAITKITTGNFCESISNIRSLLPHHTIILVVFGVEDYFLPIKQKNDSSRNARKKRQKTHNKNVDESKYFPEVSMRQFETQLNEIQIIAGCSSRLINTSQELALMIYQCTKAIAEIPYKLEKNKHLINKFDWYVMGDNRNTVRVDKDGNGLKRLWQQQLCQFSLSSLEIAEAISSVYPSPADLIEVYENCTDDEGLNLLKNIPIRRAAGPLTAVRKVGPELSKKIYIMLRAKDGKNVLS